MSQPYTATAIRERPHPRELDTASIQREARALGAVYERAYGDDQDLIDLIEDRFTRMATVLESRLEVDPPRCPTCGGTLGWAAVDEAVVICWERHCPVPDETKADWREAHRELWTSTLDTEVPADE